MVQPYDTPGGTALKLPPALVEDILRKNDEAGPALVGAIERVQAARRPVREWLFERGWIRRGPGEDAPVPTACGVDGSYVLDRMLSMSIVACAAVAVEGFTPPSEDRLWPIDHDSLVDIAAHDPRMDTKVRGAMKMMEVGLAAAAPHDVVMLDGSVTSQVIHMNEAIEAAYKSDAPNTATRMLVGRYEEFLGRFVEALEGGGPKGKIWASLPKFTTRSEIGRKYREEGLDGWPEGHDDKSVMTAVLGAGERTAPVPITTGDDKWHLPEPRRGEGDADGLDAADAEDMVGRMREAMNDQRVFYYKPREFAPAFRVEVAGAVARDGGRMDALLSSLRHQYASYAIMEPYPLYVADKMVKSLGRALPVIRHSAVQRAGAAGSIDVGPALVGLRGYRTEVGF